MMASSASCSSSLDKSGIRRWKKVINWVAFLASQLPASISDSSRYSAIGLTSGLISMMLIQSLDPELILI